MLKHYVEFYYHGIFVSETSSKQVKNRNVKIRPRKGAYGYRFFDRVEMKKDGETLYGKDKNFSGFYYFDAELLTLAEVKEKFPDQTILINNMVNNGFRKIVHTKSGGFFPYEKGNVIL